MTKRPVGFGSGIVLGAALGAALVGLGPRLFSTQSVQAAPQDAQAKDASKAKQKQATSTAPCGPNIQGDLGKNTAKDSRCFELRSYTADPTRDGVGQFKGGINELHRRFREGEVEGFKKNGVDVMAVCKTSTSRIRWSI